MASAAGQPMRRDDILRILAEHRAELAEQGTTTIALFDPPVGETGSESILDLLLEVRRPAGYLKLFGITECIEDLLGCPVNLGPPIPGVDETQPDVSRVLVRIYLNSSEFRHGHELDGDTPNSVVTSAERQSIKRGEALRLLTEHRAEFTDRGVAMLAIFGSVARDEAQPTSDVDVLVEFDRPVGLFQFIEVQQVLEQILGRSVDLGTPDALKDRVRPSVMQDLIRVF
jgi:predicted nucleotidyltransferase